MKVIMERSESVQMKARIGGKSELPGLKTEPR